MSAIMNWIAWCIAIGTPNWTRSFEYSMANSNAARAMPIAIAATPGRVRSSVIIASLKPWFSSPSRFAAGTSTSLKVMVAVFDARWPILSSCLSTDDTGVAGNHERRDAAVAGVRVGLRVDRVPVGVAAVGDEALRAVDDVLVAALDGRVRMPDTSEPASGSVRQNEASFGSSVSMPR